MFFLNFCRSNCECVLISETELLEFYEAAVKVGKNEIVGALVGIATNEEYLILSIFKYKGVSSPTSVTYNQLENSFLPAGLENLGTIHTHVGFGAFLSDTDIANLRKKKLNRIALVMDPEKFEIKAFNKDGKQIRLEIVEDHEIYSKVKVKVFYKYGIPFRVYVLDSMDYLEKAIVKSHIDSRYSDSQLFGVHDLNEDESIIYYQKPKIISLKYRNKVPLYFFIKNAITYSEWFKSAVMNGFLDFEFTNFTVTRNGMRVSLNMEEVVKDGVTEFFLF